MFQKVNNICSKCQGCAGLKCLMFQAIKSNIKNAIHHFLIKLK